MTFEEYTPLMARLIAMFPQRPIEVGTITAYFDFLQDMDAAVFQAAIHRCVEVCTWFPSVKEIRDAATAALGEYSLVYPSPEDAWLQVLQVAKGWRPGHSVRNSLPEAVFHALQVAGGMYRLNSLDDDAAILGFRREFIQAYRPEYEQDVRKVLSQPLDVSRAVADYTRKGLASGSQG